MCFPGAGSIFDRLIQSLIDLPRLFNTLRHLRPRQIAFQFFYRATGRLTQNGARTQVRRKVNSPVLPPLEPPVRDAASALPERLSEAGFCFLNRTVKFPSSGTIDWNHATHGKLWTYNLNYFEFLRQPDLDPATGQALIDSWIAAESTHRDGWEPYPTSLRLVNWLQFYRCAELPVPGPVQASVARQYANLRRKIEYHLGGNHLLENALALALTARYLADHKGRRFADQLLRAELKEQYTPAGGHYERSVMYHLILLWRQLDLLSWLTSSSAEASGREAGPSARPPSDVDLLTILTNSVQKQLTWANYIITPDGRYPHFNDSVYGIAPEWKDVRAYAEALGLLSFTRPGDTSDELPSGYARPADASGEHPTHQVWHWPSSSNTRAQRATTASPVRQLNRLSSIKNRLSSIETSPVRQPLTNSPTHQLTNSLWLNPTQISPAYLPGHAHADSLTFVLHLRGQPVVVDPAVSTYEKNARRAWERSTAAHNTVTVGDDLNSSDVWGGFRVGKRATTTVLTDEPYLLRARHDGFPGTVHTRTFALDRSSDRLTITDQLKGDLPFGTARFHFSPECEPSHSGNTVSVSSYKFTFAGASAIELFDYECATGWNQLAAARGVAVRFTGRLVCDIVPDQGRLRQ